MNRPRVLLADDHKILIEGLRGLLDPDYEFLGSVEDGRQLVSEAERLEPDVIIADVSMPLLNGIEAARQIQGVCGPRQVDGAEVTLAHGNGGVLSSQCTVLLGAESTL